MPALTAALLSLPCLGFSFLWDDYGFLTNALTQSAKDWLPQSTDPFYRPISRALYFGIVAPFGTHGALLAHVLNLVYLVVAVVCLTRIATRLRGSSFGLLTGTLFAGMYGVPTLVGWASCSQDLLAIDFVLLAIIARSFGRNGLALLSFVAALLSKETALSAIPVLVGWDWIVGRQPYRLRVHALSYAAIIILWTAIHPAARVLLARGLAPGATGYVGLTEPHTWISFLGRYVEVLANLRVGRFDPTWPVGTTAYLVLVIIGFAFAWRTLKRLSESQPQPEAQVSVRGVLVLSLLLTLPALLMTSMIINSWAPYYAGFPMLGASLLGALGLERLRREATFAVLVAYLTLGIWARGSAVDSLHVTERELRPASNALRKIEAGFHKAAPDLPRHSDVILSVQVRGISRVYAQMYVFQPLRIWYQDPSIRIMKPTHVVPGDRPVALAIIASDLDVVLLNPATFEMQTASGRQADYYTCERALRALAVGLGGAGFPNRGTQILLRIPNPSAALRSAHLHIAAMLQYSAGNARIADSLVAAAPKIPRAMALGDLHVILAEQPPHAIYDDFALKAYGIDPGDRDAIKDLAVWLARLGYAEPAERFASRLLAMAPRDPEGLRAKSIADSLLVERKKWPEEVKELM